MGWSSDDQLLAATLKLLILQLSNFVTCSFYLFGAFWLHFSKMDVPRGCCSYFFSERSGKFGEKIISWGAGLQSSRLVQSKSSNPLKVL